MLTPWKESYDQPRWHIRKWSHYFANKGPSSQSYGTEPEAQATKEKVDKQGYIKIYNFYASSDNF